MPQPLDRVGDIDDPRQQALFHIPPAQVSAGDDDLPHSRTYWRQKYDEMREERNALANDYTALRERLETLAFEHGVQRGQLDRLTDIIRRYEELAAHAEAHHGER